MSPRYALYSLCALVAALALAWGIGDWQQGRGSQAEHNAAVAQGEANAHQSQAQAHDSEVANLQAQHKADQANMDRLSRERDALLRKLASIPKPGAASVGSDPGPTEPVGADDSELGLLRATVAKDAEVIEALEADSTVKDSLIVAALKARDERKAEADALRRESAALRVALSTRPPARNWSAGVRIETKFDGSRQIGAAARRDMGPAYIEVSGFSDRAGFGFGWRF